MVKENVMKRYKSILLVLFSILACQSEIDQNENTNGDAKPMSFYAGIEIPKDSILTKTILDGSPSDAYRNVLWEYQDEVYITNGTQSSKFINTSQGISQIALLEGELADGTKYFAAYPFKIVTNSSSSSFTVDLPSEQIYCADGIESEAFPMVAQCEEGVFDFKNMCGILVVQLLGEETVSSVTFSGKDTDGNSLPVSGTGTVSMSYSDVPTLVMDNSSNTSVSLSSSTGVKLNATTPTSFHIVLPSQTYDTFELTIATKDGSKMLVHSSKPLIIKRSQRTTAAALTYVDAIDLSKEGTANCYIVSEAGKYKFNASVKGNSAELIRNIESVEVLWETLGTSVKPSVGDLVTNIEYNNGYIVFETPSVFAEGNALVAAKDASGTILWSWHIWLTDKPEEHIYYNNAGTLMDRNLGATSADAGNVTSQGLLYQWGRKDPFLGSSSIGEAKITRSTLDTWPTPEKSSELVGTIDYATNNPTTIIIKNDVNGDWLFSTTSTTDHSRWQAEKTMYDPCPNGWRVPDGGETGVWVSASELTSCDWKYDSDRHGMNFCKLFSDSYVWYPSISIISNASGKLSWFEAYNGYWSSTAASGDYSAYTSYNMNFTKVNYMSKKAYAYPLSSAEHGDGLAVRCMKEGTGENSQTNIIDLSASGTANSYIISEGGAYKFKAVQGNSSTSVGSVSSTEVLWESFGTDIAPNVGDLVNSTTFLNDYIYITIPETFVEGNAVVAAKDASGTILWSWHLWFTEIPKELAYPDEVGVFMDRNLGATSSTTGDFGSLGLLYQWGRKDPFLGSADESNSEAKSTITWPTVQPSSRSTGTVEYTINNPTTYIEDNPLNNDWLFTGSSNTDKTRWSDIKTKYDPCPSGWKVPNDDAISCVSSYYDKMYNGIIFNINNHETTWYPSPSYRAASSGNNIGLGGAYWTVTSEGGIYANALKIESYSSSMYRAYIDYEYKSYGYSVRCIKE